MRKLTILLVLFCLPMFSCNQKETSTNSASVETPDPAETASQLDEIPPSEPLAIVNKADAKTPETNKSEANSEVGSDLLNLTPPNAEELTPEMVKDQIPRWVYSNNLFRVKLIKKTQHNALISPFALERATSLLMEFAKKETLDKLIVHLIFGYQNYPIFVSEIGHILESSLSNSTFILDNRLWVDSEIDENYKTRLNKYYFGKYEIGPIKADTINKKIKDVSQGQIQKFIDKVDTASKSILTSIFVLNGKWEVAFPKENTRLGTFHGIDGDQEVQFMERIEKGCVYMNRYYYYYDLKFKSNDNKNYIFRAIYPLIEAREDQFAFFIENGFEDEIFFPDSIGSIEVACYDRVDIKLPKFRYETPLMDFSEYYKTNGIGELFDQAYQNEANEIQGIASINHFDKIYQKIVVSIDEEGETNPEPVTLPDQPRKRQILDDNDFFVYKMYYDKPFYYEIIDPDGTILIIGRMMQIPK